MRSPQALSGGDAGRANMSEERREKGLQGLLGAEGGPQRRREGPRTGSLVAGGSAEGAASTRHQRLKRGASQRGCWSCTEPPPPQEDACVWAPPRRTCQ